jgi:hypothetical protein
MYTSSILGLPVPHYLVISLAIVTDAAPQPAFTNDVQEKCTEGYEHLKGKKRLDGLLIVGVGRVVVSGRRPY